MPPRLHMMHAYHGLEWETNPGEIYFTKRGRCNSKWNYKEYQDSLQWKVPLDAYGIDRELACSSQKQIKASGSGTINYPMEIYSSWHECLQNLYEADWEVDIGSIWKPQSAHEQRCNRQEFFLRQGNANLFQKRTWVGQTLSSTYDYRRCWDLWFIDYTENVY